MGIAHGGVELQRILKSIDRFLQFPCGCEEAREVIPDSCVCAGITLEHGLRITLERGLVMGDGFIEFFLFRECVTEIALGYPISHRYIQGVLKKSDTVMPVSQLRARKPGAKHQCN